MYKQNQNGSGAGLPVTQNRPNSSNQAGKFDILQKYSNLNSIMKMEPEAKKEQLPMRPYSSQISSNQAGQIQRKDEPKQDSQSGQDANKILEDQVTFMKKILDQTQKLNSQQVQAEELNKNILQSTIHLGEDNKKQGVLQEQINHIKFSIQQAGELQKERLAQQKEAFDQQIEQLEQQIQEKDQQIEQTQKEFEGYNMEEIQSTMEKLQSENQMRDQIIKELQENLENGGQTNFKGKQPQNNKQNEEQSNSAKQQLQNKQEEIKKLEELIENFKTLYQHMNDEKQILVEENEQLSNENNQFREIFSQNLHLFGIDPNQLNDGQEDGGQNAEEQDDVEIIDENEDDDQ